jgi:ssDNA-binding Zn-finger/Zn-ribbon topoisomerase 1
MDVPDEKQLKLSVGEPKVGDRARGTDIGKRSTWLYEYVRCPDCGSTRWLGIASIKLSQGRCKKCAGLARRKPPPTEYLLEEEPQGKIGDKAKGRDIGKRRPNDDFEYVQCPECGRTRWAHASGLKTQQCRGRCRECGTRVNRTTNRMFKRGTDNVHWKGGRTAKKSGYVVMTVYPEDPLVAMATLNIDDGTYHVLEHRYVMAKHLGRCLERGEVVHHINGKRADNRIENLRLYSNEAHSNRTELEQEVARTKAEAEELKARVAHLEARLANREGGLLQPPQAK